MISSTPATRRPMSPNPHPPQTPDQDQLLMGSESAILGPVRG
jgi:hypothetical protein